MALSRVFQPHLVSLSFPQNITELFKWTSVQLVLLPQIWCQESITVTHSNESSFESVFQCLCRTGGGCVGILYTGKLKKTLDSRGSDETGTTGCWDELLEDMC